MTNDPIHNFARQLRLARWGAVTMLVALSSSVMAQTVVQLASDIETLKRVPFEELFNLEITTVSRQPERLVDAPSAVQVITDEEIRRSGASSLPEALRLASNLQVAQVDSSRWAISARGFNATTANKLIVLIDGRTAYTPLFSGVFWDVQNVMLEDIDRVEVISGPGASFGAPMPSMALSMSSQKARTILKARS